MNTVMERSHILTMLHKQHSSTEVKAVYTSALMCEATSELGLWRSPQAIQNKPKQLVTMGVKPLLTISHVAENSADICSN